MSEIKIIGDLHGSSSPIKQLCDRNPKLYETHSILICLGDFGANFFLNEKDMFFKSHLKKYPFTYFVIRGNHEERPTNCAARNPENWEIEDFLGGKVWVELDYPYIKYAMDYPSTYNINGYSTLVIPGAYSVDKFYRLSNGWSWFPEEQLTEAEMEKGRDLIKEHNYMFDLVLSHTCPICYEPTDLFLKSIDQNLVDKSMERYLGEIEYSIKYKAWCWGHYHAYREYSRDLVKPSYKDSRQLMLDWCEAVELNDVLNNPNCLKTL